MKALASIPVCYPQSSSKQGLAKLRIEEIGEFQSESLLSAKSADMLWLAGQFIGLAETPPGWSGFMTMLTENLQNYEVSSVLPLPFLNLPPSKPTTIYSVLRYSAEDAAKRNQHCLVTFDQPLYVKAVDLVLAEEPNGPLKAVTPREGGFHMFVSYMGAVGHTMAGSGLEELWQTVYGKCAVSHMISGHAYSRAWRAHSLTQQAIATLLLEDETLGERAMHTDDIKELCSVYQQALDKQLNPEDSGAVQKLVTTMEEKLSTAAERGRTGRLWVQYFKQQMSQLESRMSVEDYDKFVVKSYFAIRRTRPKFNHFARTALLHKVVWKAQATFNSICEDYLGYLQRQYGDSESICVVFDGYLQNSTKDEERLRRSVKNYCPDTVVQGSVTCTHSQQKFLSNEKNKNSFIALLSAQLQKHSIHVVRAESDADTTIVRTAVQRPRSVIVGEDTDLLALLIALSPPDSDVLLLVPGKTAQQAKIYSSVCIQTKLNEAGLSGLVLFAHAVSGCDTTSSIFKKGKVTVWKKIKDCNSADRNELRRFNEANLDQQEVQRIGEKFLLKLYGARQERNLNTLRHVLYQRTVARQDPGKVQKGFEMASFPPTSEAAHQHALRVYLQVQDWLGMKLRPEEWGWSQDQQSGRLYPVPTLKPTAPEFLLKMAYCSCSSDCGNRCPCRPNKCTTMCNCSGHACGNAVAEEDVAEQLEADPDDPEVMQL
ncbi:uncharacterized protein LOC117650724 [Thrips palmi]|uniref:Uncharacterized protein LOC117650724 n=1 Tax=Thrips palmi TaxID=161013 RepID=A0A6P8ZYK2_THRPL|nr:uncharacterized protein LOC117650724 [Thrips palmi]